MRGKYIEIKKTRLPHGKGSKIIMYGDQSLRGRIGEKLNGGGFYGKEIRVYVS